MAGKMMASEDHRYNQKPRPAMNIDIVRRLAVAQDTDVACTLIAAVSAWFGGFSHLKCLTDLATTDPAAAASRYHMLPVMLTVEFTPAGWTVGTMLVDTEVQAAWAARRATHPGCVSGEQWRQDHDAAVQVLMRVDPTTPLKQHCEVQLVLKELAEIRHGMHEIYKLKRADSGPSLYADTVKPEIEAEDEQDLFVAAHLGRIETVERLLAKWTRSDEERRLHVNQRRDVGGGNTALYLSAQNGHFPVVLALLEADADPALANPNNGCTSVWIAAQYGHMDVLALLLEANADPSSANIDNGTTPLLIAASNGHADVLTLLLEVNADPSATSTDGTTPVFAAAQNGYANVLALLLEANADPSAERTADGASPVCIAALQGHADVLSLLLEANAAPSSTTTTDGRTPVWIAAAKGHADVLALLLDANADPSAAKADNGATPVYMAAQKGRADVLKLLLEAKADPCAANTVDGQTPAFTAAEQGHVDVLALLLKANADPSAATIDDGQTPAITAARKGHLNVLTMLLDARADPAVETTNPSGITALMVAQQQGHTAIVSFLTEHLEF
jgi:ankyrin repeat protein